MRITHRLLLAGCGILAATTLFAQETKIQRGDLPPAVRKSVDSESRGATVRGFSKEVENGQTYYEAELVVNGHSKDVLIDESGKVVEVEEQVALDSLPAAVQQGLRSKAGSGKIGTVESLTKRGKLVAYEAQVQTAGRRSEIQVGPEGKSLAHKQ